MTEERRVAFGDAYVAARMASQGDSATTAIRDAADAWKDYVGSLAGEACRSLRSLLLGMGLRSACPFREGSFEEGYGVASYFKQHELDECFDSVLPAIHEGFPVRYIPLRGGC